MRSRTTHSREKRERDQASLYYIVAKVFILSLTFPPAETLLTNTFLIRILKTVAFVANLRTSQRFPGHRIENQSQPLSLSLLQVLEDFNVSQNCNLTKFPCSASTSTNKDSCLLLPLCLSLELSIILRDRLQSEPPPRPRHFFDRHSGSTSAA